MSAASVSAPVAASPVCLWTQPTRGVLVFSIFLSFSTTSSLPRCDHKRAASREKLVSLNVLPAKEPTLSDQYLYCPHKSSTVPRLFTGKTLMAISNWSDDLKFHYQRNSKDRLSCNSNYSNGRTTLQYLKHSQDRLSF